MAITKIHAIKTTLNKAINYITNPDKTDGQYLVTGYNCEALTAHLDFKITNILAKDIKGLNKNNDDNENLAYHLIQSFSPEDDVTPEQAHEIGKKLADEFLENKFEYVIATHIDKGHIHNHIIINAVSFYDFKKLRTQPYKTASKIRAISDRLCSEHDLSIVKNRGQLGYSYKEYLERKKGTSWKADIRKRLNYILETAISYENFKTEAMKLGVEVNDSGAHIKYRLEDQERYTRGNKLADTDRFLTEGIKDIVNNNKHNILFLQNSIKEVVQKVNDYQSFVQAMKDIYSVTIKKERNGNTVYLIDDMENSVVVERALGKHFCTDCINSSILRKTYEFDQPEESIDTLEEYNKTVKTQVDENSIRIILKPANILKITIDGILIKVPDEYGEIGKVFINSSHINYLENEQQYEMYIGSKFDYFFVADNTPDVLESKQLSSKFIKGESLIRSIELTNGIEPTEIQVSATNIKSVSTKGVSITLPEKGIENLFIENKYVQYDKLNGTCKIKIYENWTYGYKGQDSVKKNEIKNISGKLIISELHNKELGDNNLLVRKLLSLEKRITTNDTKLIAETLLLLRRDNISHIQDFDIKIDELKETCKSITESIKNLDVKNTQYKEVAKYIVSYNKYIGVKLDYERQSVFAKKSFYKKYESEILAFEYAEKNLEKLGINSAVDPEKVIELIKHQERQINELKGKFKETEKTIDKYRNAKDIVESITKSENAHDNKRIINKDKSNEER